MMSIGIITFLVGVILASRARIKMEKIGELGEKCKVRNLEAIEKAMEDNEKKENDDEDSEPTDIMNNVLLAGMESSRQLIVTEIILLSDELIGVELILMGISMILTR